MYLRRFYGVRHELPEHYDLAAETGKNYCAKVTSIQADGGNVTRRFEERNDTIRNRGIERTVVAFTAEVKSGKIVSFVQWSDQRTRRRTELRNSRGYGAGRTPLPTPTRPAAEEEESARGRDAVRRVNLPPSRVPSQNSGAVR